jgi:hypothetical protein
MSAALEQRARQYRSRMLVRAWDYRQRHHARGVWYRLRRLLADAEHAYVVSSRDAAQLCEEGFAIEAVGNALQPPKIIVRAPRTRVASLASAREVPVSLGGDLLNAECLVLVPFESAAETESSLRVWRHPPG